MEAPSDPFTPFRPDLDAPIRDAIRRWLTVPDAWTADVHVTDSIVSLRLSTPDAAPLRLSLSLSAEGPWSADGVSVRCHRHTDNIDAMKHPTLRRYLADLSRVFGNSSTSTRAASQVRSLWRQRLHTVRLEDRHFRSLERGTHGLTGMLRLGFGCNQRCSFCWQDRQWPNPPRALVSRWLDELAAAGCDFLTLSGGEPTLYPDLLALVRRATEVHGLKVHLQTNAVRLDDPTYTRSLVSAGLDSVLVSLHAANATISDGLTRAPATHERTLRGVEQLLDAGAVVRINAVIEEANVHELVPLAHLLVDRFVRPFPANPLLGLTVSQPSDYGDRSVRGESAVEYLDRIVALDEVRPGLVEAGRILGAAGVSVAVQGSCGFPSCAVREAPELFEWTPRSRFDDAHIAQRQQDTEACKACVLTRWCAGVRTPYLQKHGERDLVPYTEVPAFLQQRAHELQHRV
jgi:sulfatase maturation enzyme AslB (radical SAM superfamily)